MHMVPHSIECHGTTHAQDLPNLLSLDVTQPLVVRQLLERLRPEWILMPAANPNVDLCEREPQQTRAINVDAVETVARVCADIGAKLVYFSSDYVFDGEFGPYTENASINPICEYGRQKRDAEDKVRQILTHSHIIVRTTGVYGLERLKKNFVYRVVSALERGDVLTVPEDQYGNPTLAEDLARAVWSLCKLKSNGIFHVAGRDLMNRLEFAQLIAQVFGHSTVGLKGVATQALGQVASRPLNAGLTSARAETQVGRAMVGAREGLEQIREGVRRGLEP